MRQELLREGISRRRRQDDPHLDGMAGEHGIIPVEEAVAAQLREGRHDLIALVGTGQALGLEDGGGPGGGAPGEVDQAGAQGLDASGEETGMQGGKNGLVRLGGVIQQVGGPS